MAPTPRASTSRGDSREPRSREGSRSGNKKRPKRIEPRVQTLTFGENEYTGIVLTTSQGKRYLQSESAKYTWANGIKYEGPFVDSDIIGRGKISYPDGAVYEGELWKGKRHGSGCHTRPDGCTKYDGEWLEGRRHGFGRLSYDDAGRSYYEGEWRDDRKHGHGKQVWPSGNVYEGQWNNGEMSGEGQMSWTDGPGLPEVYSGSWDASLPEGTGTHTWLAASPQLPGKELPSQHMNNRYEGEWARGQRHGVGTFYYASSAAYTGEWHENVKQGQGKYTSEDGHVFRGRFADGRMTGEVHSDHGVEVASGYPGPPRSSRSQHVNLGAEDNPIRQCIDLSDLEAICLPDEPLSLDPTVAAAPAVVATSPSPCEGKEQGMLGEATMPLPGGARGSSPSPAPGEASHREERVRQTMRSVHNMLLRHLGDLKQFYSNYRLVLPLPSSPDPFVLTMHQLWFFARDMQILTPACSISRFNRTVLNGPRHHREAGTDEEIQELRPLTPRQPPQVLRAKEDHLPPLVDRDDHRRTTDIHGGEHTAASSRAVSRRSTPNSTVLSRASPLGSDMYGDGGNDQESIDGDADEGPESPAGGQKGLSRLSHHSVHMKSNHSLLTRQSYHSAAGEGILGHHDLDVASFWRGDKAGSALADIHRTSTPLHTRHFLEGVARMAMARFPDDCGLESQLRRLFRERVGPRLGTAPASPDPALALLVDDSLRRACERFDPVLWQLFKALAIGDGAHGPPPCWEVSPLASPAPESESGTAASAASEEEAGEASLDQRLGRWGVRRRTCRRGLGGVNRRAQVRARLDVTIRVKDVLQLLNGMGLLSNVAESPADNFAAVYPATVKKVDEGMERIEELQGLQVLQGGEEEGADTRISTQDHFFSPCAAPPPTGAAADGAAASGNDDGAPEVDYTIDWPAVVAILLEVIPTSTIGQLRWSVRGDNPCVQDLVPILDYLETELTFAEFRRLLFRLVEAASGLGPAIIPQTGSVKAASAAAAAAAAAVQPLAERLEQYLEKVFLPALRKPYQSPAASVTEDVPAATASDGKAPSPTDEVAAEAIAGSERASPEDTTAAAPQNEERQASKHQEHSLWLGFDGCRDDGNGAVQDAEEAAAPRQPPQDYYASLAEW
eukprot:TRINITY_DN4163_c0_g1_i3.p1 TRINITY_DN4163_c0_g1~~TRINITY_DN4163_c0_g1_i3.p1  ORF type:complete len:1144 (+),score=236.26 TRINITY_DN4163_c0_g1_i3:55-3432(+)